MKLRFEQFVGAPRDLLFEFHCDPANLAALLEGWHGFELLAHSGHIRPGARVRVLQALGLLRHEMEFEHFVFEPPLRFGERQLRGPFARFEHVHEFEATGDGTTIVDRIEFVLPWYRGSLLAERIVAAPVFRRFFAFRRDAYRRLCAAGCFR